MVSRDCTNLFQQGSMPHNPVVLEYVEVSDLVEISPAGVPAAPFVGSTCFVSIMMREEFCSNTDAEYAGLHLGRAWCCGAARVGGGGGAGGRLPGHASVGPGSTPHGFLLGMVGYGRVG